MNVGSKLGGNTNSRADDSNDHRIARLHKLESSPLTNPHSLDARRVHCIGTDLSDDCRRAVGKSARVFRFALIGSAFKETVENRPQLTPQPNETESHCQRAAGKEKAAMPKPLGNPQFFRSFAGHFHRIFRRDPDQRPRSVAQTSAPDQRPGPATRTSDPDRWHRSVAQTGDLGQAKSPHLGKRPTRANPVSRSFKTG